MADLRISAAEVTAPGRTYDDCRARYLTAIGPIRPTLLDDQVKLNDPGASQYIIKTLAQDGWNGLLRFHEGEIWRLRNRAGRRCARGARLCRRGALSRRAGRRLALARDHADEGRAGATRRGRPSPAIWQWRPMRPTPPVRQMVAG